MRDLSKRILSFLLAALIIIDVFVPLPVSAKNYEINKRIASKDLIIDEEDQSAPKNPGNRDLLIYQENEENKENRENRESQKETLNSKEEKKRTTTKKK